MAKIVQLKDRDNFDICPVGVAAATYMKNGVSVEEKLNQVDNKQVTVDDSLDSTSLNPVQNKVVTEKFNEVLAAAKEAYELACAAL